MAGETFKFNFITNGEGIKTISEPIGFDAVPFTFKQDEKRLGRDKFFGGDNESEFTFTRMRNHEFETLVYYHETFGWESEVQLIIEKDGIDNIIGVLDFQTAKTDQLNEFKCKVIQDTNQMLIKRRSDVNVDVFSDKNIDDEDITPLISENVLIKAKPITESSSWETSEAFNKSIDVDAGQLESDTEYFIFNPAIALKKFDINDSLIPFQNFREVETLSTSKNIKANDFILIETQNNLRNIEIEISNLEYFLSFNIFYGKGHCDYGLEIRYGTDWETANIERLFNGRLENGDSYNDSNTYNVKIDYLNRGDKIWFYFDLKINALGSLFNGSETRTILQINSVNIDTTATSIAYNTIAPSIRLHDGISQVVKSISGLTTSFPFAELSGEMYNQRIFSGNLLRNITDRAFNITFEDITKWFPEIYADYQVNGDGSVFIGLHKDFYQNKEIGVFTDVRFDSYSKPLNPKHAINVLRYKYKKFASQKENETENTFDIAHGETEWSVLNRFVENKKEVEVSFVRDAFYIDEQRRKAFDLNNNTSTQDDDTIFILDTKELTDNLVYNETDFLQHTYNEETGYLKLTNTGSFSFVLLGLAVGEPFNILGGDANAGNYTLIEVSERYIVINKGSGSLGNNGERITEFQYIVSPTTAPYISWSNEGFSYIDGIIDTDNFANLKYTIKRNIRRFYNSYLATCNLFSKKPIKNTEYKNNGLLELSYDGFQTIESESFTPDNPILSPYIHEITLVMDFNTFIDTINKAKLERGYIRVYDANTLFVKGYIKEASFIMADEQGEVKMVLEEKYETSMINIVKSDLKYLIVNNEYRLTNINYKIDGEKILIMDNKGYLLYAPTWWHKITINGVNYDTKEKLIEGLTLLT